MSALLKQEFFGEDTVQSHLDATTGEGCALFSTSLAGGMDDMLGGGETGLFSTSLSSAGTARISDGAATGAYSTSLSAEGPAARETGGATALFSTSLAETGAATGAYSTSLAETTSETAGGALTGSFSSGS